eukprot:1367158-Amorphochlora_amoeboformis.AAC.1
MSALVDKKSAELVTPGLNVQENVRTPKQVDVEGTFQKDIKEFKNDSKVRQAKVMVVEKRSTHLTRIREKYSVVHVGWLRRHPYLRKAYFPILGNWLVELHFELFRAHSRKMMARSPLRIVHLTMRYVFKYLAHTNNVIRERLQLVGVSCYALAVFTVQGKRVMEKMALDTKKFAFYTDDAYKPEQVAAQIRDVRTVIFAAMEPESVKNLHPLQMVTPVETLRALIRTLGLECNTLLVCFANFMIDLSTHDIDCGAVYPTEIAAAALLSACRKMNVKVTKEMYKIMTSWCYSRSIESLERTARAIEMLFKAACAHETGHTVVGSGKVESEAQGETFQGPDIGSDSEIVILLLTGHQSSSPKLEVVLRLLRFPWTMATPSPYGTGVLIPG